MSEPSDGWAPPPPGPPVPGLAPPAEYAPIPPTSVVAYHRLAQRERGAWWRLVVSVVAGTIGLFVAAIVAVLGVLLAARALGFGDFTFSLTDGINAGEMLATNLGLALLIPVAGFLYWAVYRRSPRWLTSTVPGLRLRWLLVCTGMASAVWSLFLVLGTASAYISRTTPVDSGVVWFLVVVLLTTPLQAAGEEFLFRGLILQALGATRLPTTACCVASGALFATAHLQFAAPLFADRFVLGVVLSWIAIRTGGLEAGIAIHAVKNLSALIPAALLENVSETLDPTGVTWVPLALDVVLLGILTPWLFATYRKRERVARAPSVYGAHAPPPRLS